MNKKDLENIAYIDGTNLHKGFKTIGVEIDYFKLRKWLFNKYDITNAYIFMGYIKEKKLLYKYLKKAGFNLIFKESVLQNGVIKGNADSEMVLKSVRDYFEENIESVVIVSGDGDFSCLVDFLIEKDVLKILLMPNRKYSSYLLRKKQISKEFLETSRILNQIKRKNS